MSRFDQIMPGAVFVQKRGQLAVRVVKAHPRLKTALVLALCSSTGRRFVKPLSRQLAVSTLQNSYDRSFEHCGECGHKIAEHVGGRCERANLSKPCGCSAIAPREASR